VRPAAAVAGLVLAVTGTGDVLVVAVCLAVAARRVSSTLALVAAGVAATARWGSPDLAAIAGGQAVLGPAGLLEPPLAGASAWCAALAVVVGWSALAAPSSADRPSAAPSSADQPDGAARTSRMPALRGPAGRSALYRLSLAPSDLVGAAAAGALAASLVWGPGGPAGWAPRGAGTVVASAAAAAVLLARWHPGVDRALACLAVTLGGVAVLAAVAARPAPVALAAPAFAASTVGVAALATAVAVVAPTWSRRAPVGGRAWPRSVPVSAAVGLWALAAQLGDEVRPALATPAPPTAGLGAAAGLLAAAAAVGLVAGPAWTALAASPGLAALVHGLLGVGGDGPLPVVTALLLAVTVLAVLVAALGPDGGRFGVAHHTQRCWATWRSPSTPELFASLACRCLAVVLAVAPLHTEGLVAWREGAAAGLAVVALVVVATAAQAAWREPGSEPAGAPGASARYARPGAG
jgi:hypothetical protein